MKALNAAFFAGVGSLAFHVASLTSGYSIYRELERHVSILVSGTLGLLLLLILPPGFLIFLRGEFGDTRGTGQYFSYEHYTEIWSLDSIGPYLMSTVGFGLIIGGLTMIKARVLFWKWFRSKSGMLYPIYSYDHIWDVFLHSLKRGGRLRILRRTKNPETSSEEREWLAGRILHFSERREGRELFIEREDGERVLVPGREVLLMEAPRKAFSRDHQLIATYSRAFYLLLAAFGAVLAATSVHLTQGWIRRSGADGIDPLEIYAPMELILELCALALVVISVTTLCRRYTNYLNKWFALHPVFVVTAAILFMLVATMPLDNYTEYSRGFYEAHLDTFGHVRKSLAGIGIIILGVFALPSLWSLKITGAERRLVGLSKQLDVDYGRELVDKCLDMIYLNYDWNSDDEWYEDAFRSQVIRIIQEEGSSCPDVAAQIARRFLATAEDMGMSGDEINLVYWVQNFRRRERARRMRRTLPGELTQDEYLAVWVSVERD